MPNVLEEILKPCYEISAPGLCSLIHSLQVHHTIDIREYHSE